MLIFVIVHRLFSTVLRVYRMNSAVYYRPKSLRTHSAKHTDTNSLWQVKAASVLQQKQKNLWMKFVNEIEPPRLSLTRSLAQKETFTHQNTASGAICCLTSCSRAQGQELSPTTVIISWDESSTIQTCQISSLYKHSCIHIRDHIYRHSVWFALWTRSYLNWLNQIDLFLVLMVWSIVKIEWSNIL